MAVAVVTDGAAGASANATTSVAATATFPNSHTATAGNLLLLLVVTFHTTRLPAGSGGTGTPGGFTLLSTHNVNNNNNRTARVYGLVAVGGETGVSAYTDSASTTRQSIFIYEISGADAAGVVALTSGYLGPNTGSAGTGVTTMLSTSLNPTETSDVLFIDMVYVGGPYTASSASFDSSFANLIEDNSTVRRAFSGRLIVNNPGATTVSGSWTTSQQAGNLLVAIPSAPVGAATRLVAPSEAVHRSSRR